VRGGVQGPHPFGDLIAAGTSDVRDLVEVEVEVPEVRAHDVPVGLLGGEAQGDEIDEHRLEVLTQIIRGDEAVFGFLSRCLLPTLAGVQSVSVSSLSTLWARARRRWE